MKTVTVSEFRKNIKKYAELAHQEKILVNRGDGKAFYVVPIDKEPDNGYSTEFVNKVLEAEESVNNGNVTRVEDSQNIWKSIL